MKKLLSFAPVRLQATHLRVLIESMSKTAPPEANVRSTLRKARLGTADWVFDTDE